MSYGPEVFYLVLDAEHYSSFDVCEIDAESGGYFLVQNEVPIGRLANTDRFNSFYGISMEDRSVIELIPMLHGSKVAEVADVLKFLQTLCNFLRHNEGWAIICERGIDAGTVDMISSNWLSVESAVSHVTLFWKGVLASCPSFIARKKM